MKVKELFEAKERSVLSVMGQQGDCRGDFTCDFRDLRSLEGSPRHVGGDFDCDNNMLTSLRGGPETVGGSMHCYSNALISLEGVPSSIPGDLTAWSNKLTSLRGIHKQIKHIGGRADFNGNPIKSHVLGLLKIDGLKTVQLDNTEVEDIINKYLAGDKDIFACQEELIEAKFPKFAQL